MSDRKCQNTVLKEKVGRKSTWGLCLNTFTPPAQTLKTSSRIPRQYKGSALLSSSQTHVQIPGDIAVNRCQNTTAVAAVTRLLWNCPGECDARAGLGSSRVPILHFCKVCYGRNETWQWKGWGEVEVTFRRWGWGRRGWSGLLISSFLYSNLQRIWFISWRCGQISLRSLQRSQLDFSTKKKERKKEESSFWDSERVFFSINTAAKNPKVLEGIMTSWPPSK